MKKRNKVNFTYMDIYLFGRCLGSDKVPESGNNPLGMEDYHFSKEKVNISNNLVSGLISVNGDSVITSTPQPKRNFSDSSSHVPKILSQDSLQSILSIDYTTKSLQPMNPKQRIKCLKEAGVEMIKDQSWADEGKCLVRLRHDRQQVGCKCAGANTCDPLRCICSKEGIPCQSDGSKFPCKCGPKCANAAGKRIYSHLRIKYHYRHTFERDLNEDCTSELSKDGDCHICNEISEEALQKIFVVPAVANRKRTASAKSIQNNTLVELAENVPDVITPMAGSTVMILSLSTFPEVHRDKSVSYDDLFKSVSSPHTKKDNAVEKENRSFPKIDDKVNEGDIYNGSPPKQQKCAPHHVLSSQEPARRRWMSLSPSSSQSQLTRIRSPSSSVNVPNFSTSPQSRRFNESQEEIPNLNERISICDQNSNSQPETYWDSFINSDDVVVVDLTGGSPSSSEPDTGASEVGPRLKLVDYSTDTIGSFLNTSTAEEVLTQVCATEEIEYIDCTEVLVDDKSYRFRHRTGNSKLLYFESPQKMIKKRKLGRQSTKFNNANFPAKGIRSPEFVVEETNDLADNIAEISLIQFRDIPALDYDDEGADPESGQKIKDSEPKDV